MSEEAKKVRESIGKVTPQELGTLFKNYFSRIEIVEPVKVVEKTAAGEILRTFDGGLPMELENILKEY